MALVAQVRLAVSWVYKTLTMYAILASSFGVFNYSLSAEIAAAFRYPKPSDPWLFTSPIAQRVYAQQGRLGQLKADIRAYSMYHRHWTAEELELKCEIRRLMQANVLTAKAAFGHLSPHPTLYTAVSEGVLEIAGQKSHFQAGNDIVFEPWLARLSSPGLHGPVRIGRLQIITDLCLCGERYSWVSACCEKAFAVMRHTLYEQPKPARA